MIMVGVQLDKRYAASAPVDAQSDPAIQNGLYLTSSASLSAADCLAVLLTTSPALSTAAPELLARLPLELATISTTAFYATLASAPMRFEGPAGDRAPLRAAHDGRQVEPRPVLARGRRRDAGGSRGVGLVG